MSSVQLSDSGCSIVGAVSLLCSCQTMAATWQVQLIFCAVVSDCNMADAIGFLCSFQTVTATWQVQLAFWCSCQTMATTWWCSWSSGAAVIWWVQLVFWCSCQWLLKSQGHRSRKYIILELCNSEIVVSFVLLILKT